MATKDAARQAILDIAMDLFDRFGPAKTSVADIAREAGMSSANIYNFFASRDAIIEAAGEVTLSALKCAILADIRRETDCWTKIRLLFLSSGEHLRIHLQNEKDILYLQVLERKYHWQFIDRFGRFLRSTVEETITQGVAAGAFRKMDPLVATPALFDCMLGGVDALTIVRVYGAGHERRLAAQIDLLEHAFRR